MIATSLSTWLLACNGAGVPWVTPEPSEGGAEVVAQARTLLATDLLVAEFSAPFLYGDAVLSNDCPEVRNIRDGSESIWELSYGAGCVPDSGLLGEELAGIVELRAEGDIAAMALVDFQLAGRALEGSGVGLIEDTGDSSVTVGLELNLASTSGDFAVAREVELELEQLRGTLDGPGSLALEGATTEATVDGLQLYWDDIDEGCAMPSAGATVLTGAVTGELAFSASGAADGTVEVTTDAGVETVRFCEVESLF